MAVKDLLNQISRSKIVSKAKELLDTDRQNPGFQFNVKQGLRNIALTPVPQFLQEPAKKLEKFSTSAERSAFGIPLRTVKSIGGQSAQDATASYQAFKEGRPLEGIYKGAKSIAPYVFAPKNAAFTAGSMALSSGLAGLTGQDQAQALSQSFQTAPITGQFIKFTNPFISKGLAKIKAPQIIQNRISPAIANIGQGLGIDIATGQQTTPLSVGIDALTGIAGKQNAFGDVPNAKGFDFGRNSKSRWQPEDVNELDAVTDFIRGNKKLSGSQLEEADKVVTSLAKGYLPISKIEKLASDYGKNSRGYLKALTDEMQSSLRSQEGMGAIKMGFTEPKIKTNLTKAIKNNEPEKIIKTIQKTPVQKQKGFIKTVLSSDKTSQELKESVSKIDSQLYIPVKNLDTVAQAKQIVDKSFDDARALVTKGTGDEKSTAVGLELVRRLQTEGKFNEAIKIIEELDEQGRQSGRLIQSLSLWNRLTPEGMIRFAKRTFEQANERSTALKQIELDDGLQKQIYDKMTQVQKMADGPEKTKATKEVLELINEKIPPSLNEMFDAYRYQNMLSSPRTQMRNIYGNFFQAVVTRPATMGAEVVVDNVQAMLRGTERTRYMSEVPEYYKSMFNMIPNGVEGFMEAMKGQDIDIKKPDLRQIETKRLPSQLTFVTRFMEGMDKFFQGVIGGAEYNRLIKSGLDKDEALRQSSQKAQELLFRAPVDTQNKSGQGLVLSAIDNASQGISELGRRIPPVRWAVPFIQTPMNVFKQTLEFTPGVGLSTLIGSTRKNEQLAKQLVGSVIMAYGAKKAMEGDLVWAAPTDAKEKELFYASGKKPFSVRVGDTYIPIVYFGPLASAFIIPAASKYYSDESKTALTDSQVDKLGKISLSMLEYLSGQTFLEGLGNIVDIMKGDDMASVANSAAFTTSQLVPLSGLVRYVNTILDPVYRKARGFKESLMVGIPGLSTQLEAYTDPNGNLSTRLPINYAIPFDIGKARQEWELPLRQRQELNQQRNILNVAKKELKMGRNPDTKGITSQQSVDLIREKIKYGMDVSEDDLYSAYLNKPLSMKSTNKYEKSLRDSELYGKISDINSNEYLSEDQKSILMEKVAKELAISKAELDYYQVAKNNNDQKTMYVLDQVPKFTNETEFTNYLVEGRRKVNGAQLVSSGVIDNLVDEGLISEALGKQLKKITFDKKTGKVGTGRAKKGTKVKTITPPEFKVSTRRSKIEAPKIKSISGLDSKKYRLKSPSLKTDDIKIRIRQ